MFKVIPFGHRCTSASFIKALNLKTESYPFDWMISKLDVIQHCIETNFIEFMNADNYVLKRAEVYNFTDGTKLQFFEDNLEINKFYEGEIKDIQFYHYKLGFYHRKVTSDEDYFKRCIERLYTLFSSDIQKYYIHFNPIIGINDFTNTQETILNSFDNFSNFITTKTKNIFGLFFIIVKHEQEIKSLKIRETANYAVFIIYCNNDFIDGGWLFEGNCSVENQEVFNILKNYFL
jgi:hypothetical protein